MKVLILHSPHNQSLMSMEAIPGMNIERHPLAQDRVSEMKTFLTTHHNLLVCDFPDAIYPTPLFLNQIESIKSTHPALQLLLICHADTDIDFCNADYILRRNNAINSLPRELHRLLASLQTIRARSQKESTESTPVSIFQEMLPRLNIGFFNLDVSGRIQRFQNTWPGISPEKITGSLFSDYVDPFFRHAFEIKLKRVMGQGESTDCIVKTAQTYGALWQKYVMTPVWEEGKITGAALLCQDISDKKSCELMALTERNLSNAIMDTADALMVVLDKQGHIIRYNKACMKVSGYSREEVGNRKISDTLIYDEDIDKFLSILIRLSSGIVVRHAEYRWKRKFASPRLISWSHTLLLDSDDKVQYIICIGIDMTQQREAEEAKEESERKLSTLVNNLSGFAYRHAPDEMGCVEYISNGCLEITGYAPDNLLGLSIYRFITESDKEMVLKSKRKAAEKKESYILEYQVTTKKNETKYVWEKGSGVYSDEGELMAYEGFITDITDKKQAEAQIQKDLKEKVILLQEVHHRVKNNLQIIISLLTLQSSHIKNPQVNHAFEEIQNRIRSLALVHEELYRSNDFSNIDFKNYIETLVGSLYQAYFNRSQPIEYKMKIEPVSLALDTAIPLGLVINELVSNALKHAFPPHWDKEGCISIAIKRLDDCQIRLSVQDNGVGLPDDLNPHEPESLGIQLVTMLVEDQLEGLLQIKEKPGTSYEITINLCEQ